MISRKAKSLIGGCCTADSAKKVPCAGEDGERTDDNSRSQPSHHLGERCHRRRRAPRPCLRGDLTARLRRGGGASDGVTNDPCGCGRPRTGLVRQNAEPAVARPLLTISPSHPPNLPHLAGRPGAVLHSTLNRFTRVLGVRVGAPQPTPTTAARPAELERQHCQSFTRVSICPPLVTGIYFYLYLFLDIFSRKIGAGR